MSRVYSTDLNSLVTIGHRLYDTRSTKKLSMLNTGDKAFRAFEFSMTGLGSQQFTIALLCIDDSDSVVSDQASQKLGQQNRLSCVSTFFSWKSCLSLV